MSSEIVVAILSLAGTIIGSAFGVITSSRLTLYRLEQLEKKVQMHNNIIERTYILEGKTAELERDVHDLRFIKT